MVRTQIQLTERQTQRLKALAKEQGVSMAELIRRSVDQLLDSQATIDWEERSRRAIAIAGKFRSEVSDLGVNHDEYLVEAYEA